MSGKRAPDAQPSAEEPQERAIDARSVEEALARLEEIVRRLEGGEVELSVALALCREGRDLHDFCVRQIGAFEAQLEILAADGALLPEGEASAAHGAPGKPGAGEGEE